MLILLLVDPSETSTLPKRDYSSTEFDFLTSDKREIIMFSSTYNFLASPIRYFTAFESASTNSRDISKLATCSFRLKFGVNVPLLDWWIMGLGRGRMKEKFNLALSLQMQRWCDGMIGRWGWVGCVDDGRGKRIMDEIGTRLLDS